MSYPPPPSTDDFPPRPTKPGKSRGETARGGRFDHLPRPESWATVTPADIARSIRRRLPSVVVTTLLVTAAVVALLIVWPNEYRSEGLMYVRLGRGALAVDPTTKANSSVSMQESRTAEVISIGRMIDSREIAERAVERVGVENINRPRTWPERAADQVKAFLASDHRLVRWLPKSEKSIGDWSPQQVAEQLDRERAIENLVKAVKVEIAENGYTVAVTGKENDPLLIQSLVQAVMDEYGRYHVEAHRNVGSQPFFEQQTEESHRLAMAARERLQATQNEMGWLSAESAELSLRERIIDLEASLNTAESELAEASSQADQLRRQLDQTEQWVPTTVTLGIANAAGDQLRSQLYDVQVEDGEELAKISPNHPRYRRLQEKITQGEAIAQAERTDRTERTEATNPVYQALETQWQTVRAKAVGLESRRDALQQRLDATALDLQRLNRDRITLARLTWEANLSEETYLDHARSLEEARVNSELDAQNLSDVSIIQDASLNLTKSGPARGVLSVVGLMLGLSLGLLQAILRDSPLSVTGPAIPEGTHRTETTTAAVSDDTVTPARESDPPLSQTCAVDAMGGSSTSSSATRSTTTMSSSPGTLATAGGGGAPSSTTRRPR